jgi:cellulose biosynthesis protein BcsQ
VNKEIEDINYNMEKGIRKLEKREVGKATSHQQYVMTGFNNLALMLSDVMESMQQKMASQMKGSQMCQKSGGKGKKGLPKLSKMQQQLNKQMQQMKQEMKDGQKPGKKGGKQSGKKGNKKGGKQSGGKGGMSEKLAKMARKQAAIRKAIQEMSKEENKTGKNSLGDLDKLADEMEQTEEDIVNKQLSEQMLERQEKIKTRLLEAEKAMRQRKTKNEREAKTAEEQERKMPPSIEEYIKKREAEVELYKTLPPTLKPYYKFLVEKYFKSIRF